MAPGSQAPTDVPAGRSGGKILKARATTARKTPYDRPTPPQTQHPLLQPESPSWLSGLALPAKFVAGGASKIFSSFWNPKSWGTPSSSSSDGDFESEDDSGDSENPSHELIELNQNDSLSEKNQTLHLIEQLLMLEQYSRQERDRLIEIINSRVVDDSMREGMAAGPSMIHSRTNNETPIHSQAIMEAKKWVAEKKVRSGLSDFDNGIYGLKSAITPQTAEGEAGTPIDVAKSYMRTRPPWASPINHDNSLSPLPLAADLFKEKAPCSSGGSYSLSSSKRDHLSAGSWNIQEEIRRVRSKATEDMLSNHQSMKLTSFTLEHDTPKHTVANDKPINVVERDDPINLETPKSVDEIVNRAASGGPTGLSASELRVAQNNLPTEDLPSHPKMPDLEPYQGMDSVKVIIDGQDAASNKSHHFIHSDKEQNTQPSSEGNKLEKEKEEINLDQENDRTVDDRNEADKNCFLMAESSEIPLVNNSQSSPSTNDLREDGTLENRVVTRASRRGKTRGK